MFPPQCHVCHHSASLVSSIYKHYKKHHQIEYTQNDVIIDMVKQSCRLLGLMFLPL